MLTLAECGGVVEHFFAVDGTARIPHQILIECGGKLEHLREERHLG